MSIIDSKLVEIEISTCADEGKSGLNLKYQGRKYDLVQAFASHKLDLMQSRLQQLIDTNSSAANIAGIDRYLVVQEDRYYSVWVIDVALGEAIGWAQLDRDLELQQASIWLFQELWLQWQDLLGANQLQAFADNLLEVSPPLKSGVDLDRLLSLDPLASAKLAGWTDVDLIAFDRQIYQLTQRKVGREFGTRLTIDIVESMPDSLRSILVDILDI
jgi:hypothetical protein